MLTLGWQTLNFALGTAVAPMEDYLRWDNKPAGHLERYPLQHFPSIKNVVVLL